MIVLPDAENRMIVASFISTKHRNVTEGRTDGGTDPTGSIYSGQHSKLCRRTVKTDDVDDKQLSHARTEESVEIFR